MPILDNLFQRLNVNFIGRRHIFYVLSGLMVAAAFFSYLTRGLSYGIDFKGGVMIEARTLTVPDLGSMRKTLNSLELGDISLQEYGTEQDILIRLEEPKVDPALPGGADAALSAAVSKIKGALPGVEFRRVETVGPRAGQELISNGIQAILWGLIAILVYVWIRFEWQFGLSAVIALLHNSIAVFALYLLTGIEFNTTAIVGVLTTVGYSVNDIVVVFDRIRENMKKYKKKEVSEILNLSINETLSRTILTSGATLSALLGLYFLGGEIIASYSLPIIVGVVVGTYASICLASPLLLIFKLNFQSDEESLSTPKKDDFSTYQV